MKPPDIGWSLETLTFEVYIRASTHISGVRLWSELNGLNQSATHAPSVLSVRL
jgi:hypothetical protein